MQQCDPSTGCLKGARLRQCGGWTQVGVDVLPDGTIVERFADAPGKPAPSHDVLRAHNAPHPSARDRVVKCCPVCADAGGIQFESDAGG
jgi:hypothetical protein